MIPAMSRNQTRRLGVLLARTGVRRFLFLSAAREALFLRSVVRAGLRFVSLTLVTIEVKDFLRVGAAHAASFRNWPVVVKRTTFY
jgi:hypothetical protein